MKNNKKDNTSTLFSKLLAILAAGLIFCSATAIFMGISILISILTGFSNILLWGLGIIPAVIFYSGLVTVIRKYAVEGDCAPLIKTYFSAVKKNAKAFLLHGFVAYLICSCSLFATLYYHTLAQIDSSFGYVLAIYGIFIAALVVMMFYVPLISVSYELRYRDIYKNSIKLILGNLPKNLLALLMSSAVAALAILGIVYTNGILRIIICALAGAICPTLITYIIVCMVSKGLQESLGDFAPAAPPAPDEDEQPIINNSANTEDDYIFVNGKMVRNNFKSRTKD